MAGPFSRSVPTIHCALISIGGQHHWFVVSAQCLATSQPLEPEMGLTVIWLLFVCVCAVITV
jgi:hypothetical protein